MKMDRRRVAIKLNADNQLIELSEKRKEEGDPVSSKVGILTQLIAAAHKKECKK